MICLLILILAWLRYPTCVTYRLHILLVSLNNLGSNRVVLKEGWIEASYIWKQIRYRHVFCAHLGGAPWELRGGGLTGMVGDSQSFGYCSLFSHPFFLSIHYIAR